MTYLLIAPRILCHAVILEFTKPGTLAGSLYARGEWSQVGRAAVVHAVRAGGCPTSIQLTTHHLHPLCNYFTTPHTLVRCSCLKGTGLYFDYSWGHIRTRIIVSVPDPCAGFVEVL
jgi:hypothetical protein